MSVICALLCSLWGCSADDAAPAAGSGYLRPVVVPQGADAPAPEAFALRITALAGGASHTWDTLADFQAGEAFLAGGYTVEAFYGSALAEGFDCPYYADAANAEVRVDEVTEVTLKPERLNASLRVIPTDDFLAAVQHWGATLHTSGGAYLDYPSGETRTLYMRPGAMEAILSFTLADGRSASVFAMEGSLPQGADATLTLGIGSGALELTLEGAGQDVAAAIPLTDELFTASAPALTPIGFTPGTPLVISEGVLPDFAVGMKAAFGAAPARLVLTVDSPGLRALGAPAEVNLLDADAVAPLVALGLEVTRSTDSREVTVSLTPLLDKLRTGQSPSFAMMAIDRAGRASAPLTLDLDVEPLGIRLDELESAVMGASSATAIISTTDTEYVNHLTVSISADGGLTWTPAAITGSEQQPDGRYRLTFAIGQEDVSQLLVRLDYLGAEVARGTLDFISPSFTIEADAFAHHAVVRVAAAGEAERAVVTRALKVLADGLPVSVYERDPEQGMVWVTGLQSSHRYVLTATVFTSPGEDDFTPPVEITTEGTPGIPNEDFSTTVTSISFQDLPSGGFYSQSAMPLFNRQNRVDVNVTVPGEPWATVNTKTFCTAATTLNTWFLQPSTMLSSDIITGNVSVRLVSVGFDPAGELPEPYRQIREPFLSYNPNIPAVACRAAGKLFLGSYTYTPSRGETYTQGIPFTSRPQVLNGTYSYTPGKDMPGDLGLVRVQVMGEVDGQECVIAETSRTLYPVFSATAFSVPITYPLFGVKATSLRVMIASSASAGTIAEESASIVTTPNVLTSSMTGSVLEIEGLSLSY